MDAIKNIKGKTIGFCGAGGKTTSIFFIANKLINMNQKVLITTTTKMFPEDKCKNIEIVIRETFSVDALKEKSITQWLAFLDSNGKGVSPQVSEIEKLNKYTEIWKLIEIDGSKHLPIKGPREGEPVYLKGLNFIFGVIGASAFNEPANEERVHRLEHFLRVTGLREGELISPAAVVKLIESPEGLFRNKPKGVPVCVLITQAEERHKAFIESLKALTSVPIEVMPWID